MSRLAIQKVPNPRMGNGIEPHLWIDDRPTTWKQRIVARGQLRPDRCDREVTTPIGDHGARFLSAVPLGEMVLISDYGKGACTRRLLETLGARARDAGVSILVDPDYGGATLIKANWAEATEAAGNHGNRPLDLARRLADEHRCHFVVTIGRHGMVCAERDGATWYLPAEATEVRDVCGAGDTVLVAAAVALITGKSLRGACRSAMAAARRQVAAVGIAAVA